MKILLLQDVDNLGLAGDVKTVAAGFGRNYLLPQRLAVLATPGSLKQADAIRKTGAIRRAKEKSDAEATASLIAGKTLYFERRAGDTGKLYGSVTSNDIAQVLSEAAGTAIDKRKVAISEPIRMLGEHEVAIRLMVEVAVQVKVVVGVEGAPRPEVEAAAVPETMEAEAPLEAETEAKTEDEVVAETPLVLEETEQEAPAYVEVAAETLATVEELEQETPAAEEESGPADVEVAAVTPLMGEDVEQEAPADAEVAAETLAMVEDVEQEAPAAEEDNGPADVEADEA
jgi:large subunit ribosomal protein L9